MVNNVVKAPKAGHNSGFTVAETNEAFKVGGLAGSGQLAAVNWLVALHSDKRISWEKGDKSFALAREHFLVGFVSKRCGVDKAEAQKYVRDGKTRNDATEQAFGAAKTMFSRACAQAGRPVSATKPGKRAEEKTAQAKTAKPETINVETLGKLKLKAPSPEMVAKFADNLAAMLTNFMNANAKTIGVYQAVFTDTIAAIKAAHVA